MTMSARFVQSNKYSLAFLLLIGLLAVLWFTGGASRADAAGQVVVRGVACAALVLAALGGVRPAFGRTRFVFLLLGMAVVLLLLQLVPLPPVWWQMLPGRTAFVAVPIDGAGTLWRPLALVPGATLNAMFSLIVPFAALVLIAALRPGECERLPALMLVLIGAAMLFGMIQAVGLGLVNPLVDGVPGDIAGPFANRNHFALFLAMGCIVAPAWAVAGERPAMWRGSFALGLVLLFVLTILATGSRAGLLLGAMALVCGVAVAWRGIGQRLRHVSRGKRFGLVVVVVLVLAAAILLSIVTHRAASIGRAFAIDTGEDMRSRGLPTVLTMIATYFPAGAGFGGFDPVFRLNEPHALLKPTFFNHAHDDFLEVVLDGGVAGLALILAALGWWAWASLRVWRPGGGNIADPLLPRLGSAILLLLIVASTVDYPVRTPLMMVMVVIAAAWLCNASALPRAAQQL